MLEISGRDRSRRAARWVAATYAVEVIGPDGTTRRDLVPTPNGALVPDGTLLTVNPGGSYTVRFVRHRDRGIRRLRRL